MPESCCVVDCTTRRDHASRSAGIGLFRIPTNQLRKSAWCRSISRKNWEPHTWDRVCGKHFVSGRPSDCRDDVDFVPTLFMKGDESRCVSETPRNKRAKERRTAAHMRHVALVRQSNSSV